ncbi:MAG TPA: hypothetical protein VJI75_04945 [Candidatus Nanoarchaeia archaeon]|nr:hypothetical protein [Candidatus Nanoarchaeia archaeon]
MKDYLNKDKTPQYRARSEEFKTWLVSEEGKASLEKALTEADKIAADLDAKIRLTEEQLRIRVQTTHSPNYLRSKFF